MSKVETIRKYELVVIVDAKLSNEEKEGIRKEITDVVNKAGAKVINSQVWLEKNRFTFRIKKRTEGTYYLINFEADGASADKIRPVLRLNERVLRFEITKVG